jgi:O-antigen/teichoic acid export membrane protein
MIIHGMIQNLLNRLRQRIPARVRQDANLKDLLRNSGILYVAGVISIGLTYFQQLTTANLLGAENYGRYAIVISSGLLVMLVSDFRTWEIGSKLLARPLENQDHPEFIRITSRLLLLELLTGSIGAVVIALFAQPIARDLLHAPDLTVLLPLYALSLPFRTISIGVLGVIPRFYNHFDWLAWKSIGYSVLRLVLITGAALFGLGLPGVILGVVLGEVINTLILVVFYALIWRRHMLDSGSRLFSFNRPLSNANWRKLLVDQWVSSTLAGLHYQLFIPIVALLTNPVQVGVLRSGMDIADLLERAIQPITIVFSPRIIALYEQNNLREFRRYLKQVALLLVAIMLPLSGVLLITAPFLLPRFYNPEEFVGIVPTAMWLVAGAGIFNALMWWVRPTLVAVNGLRLNNLFLLGFVLIAGLGVLVVTPQYAASGAAAVRGLFLASYALFSTLWVLYFFRSASGPQMTFLPHSADEA